MTLLRIAVPTPLRRYFDYLPPNDIDLSTLSAGMRVRVPFGKRELVGIFMEITSTSSVALNKLKPIIAIIDLEPLLPKELLELCQWTADYYHYPIGEVILGALPAKLKKGQLLPS